MFYLLFNALLLMHQITSDNMCLGRHMNDKNSPRVSNEQQDNVTNRKNYHLHAACVILCSFREVTSHNCTKISHESPLSVVSRI